MNDTDINAKKRVYLDCGASVKGFKNLHDKCQFIISPYDHESARRRDIAWELGTHSQVQWNDCNWAWSEDNQTLDEHCASEYLLEIYQIIGSDPKNRRDGLHLDSAYKSKCHAFLTNDKDDIWQYRHALEKLLGYKIFHSILELDYLKNFTINSNFIY